MSAQSRHTFYLRGWLPEKSANQVKEVVKSNFGDDVLVELSPVRYHELDQVPVELSNPALVRVFEPLIRLLALPRYGTFDPTPFMAFFFPLFFGFILGDMAYGLLLIVLSTWLYRRYRHRVLARSIAVVFILSGISATVFGLLFGEFLGDLGEHYGLHPLLMDRSRVIMPFLFIAIGLGLAHVMLGLILSFITSFRMKHPKHWISALANIMTLSGLTMVSVSAAGYLPSGDNLGIFLILLGIPMLIFSEGLMGPLEFLKTFGNVLSYARLMAIGIASVVLAKVANMVGGTAESLAVGVIVALIFHSLNFVMGVFSPTIHSLRLHYVEFFSKFFQPGGKPYQPFRRHRNL
jgi:V/A-type H+-transporting ATPase subunit I